ncbi:unnamed protein product [Dovyalis caffra]|uniref:Uncharacterized protein n=1 Tax=Dovyalis caffra TaxID=77055 RepID=A0AAV1S5T2_9ROSI|nr:unnamed protein product [Dovyalis caffra]
MASMSSAWRSVRLTHFGLDEMNLIGAMAQQNSMYGALSFLIPCSKVLLSLTTTTASTQAQPWRYPFS